MTAKPRRRAAATEIAILPPAPPSGRHDGWTLQRQADFLRGLAETHSVSAAAAMVGMTRQSAYKLRARLQGEPFDLAWDAAFQSSFDALAAAAMERALCGVEVPHYHKGELVGTSRRFDERLTVSLLGMRNNFLRPPAPMRPTISAALSSGWRAGRNCGTGNREFACKV